MVVTSNGVVTRIKAGDISRQGRPATGVKIQNLQDNDTVMTVNKIAVTDEDDYIDKAVEKAIEGTVEQPKLTILNKFLKNCYCRKRRMQSIR